MRQSRAEPLPERDSADYDGMYCSLVVNIAHYNNTAAQSEPGSKHFLFPVGHVFIEFGRNGGHG